MKKSFNQLAITSLRRRLAFDNSAPAPSRRKKQKRVLNKSISWPVSARSSSAASDLAAALASEEASLSGHIFLYHHLNFSNTHVASSHLCLYLSINLFSLLCSALLLPFIYSVTSSRLAPFKQQPPRRSRCSVRQGLTSTCLSCSPRSHS